MMASEAAINASDLKGGLLVCIGCANASELAAPATTDRFLVHILDTDSSKADVTRATLKKKVSSE